MEAHEHYHVGLELGIIGIILTSPIFIGLMVSFILAEWSQDHKFALGSSHFKLSTIIGISLFIVVVVLLL